MNYNYLQQGGLTSVPIRPVLGGQPHELSYITPEEARMLRQQGGGVTPTGGQYRGPGGLSAYVDVGTGEGHGGPAAGPGSEGGSTAAGGVGDPSGPGPGQSGVVGQSVFGMIPGHYSPYGDILGKVPGEEGFDADTSMDTFDAFSEEAALKSKFKRAFEDGMKPWRSFLNDGIFDRDAFDSDRSAFDISPGEASKMNVLGDARDRNANPGGFFGKFTGLVDTNTGETFSLGDIANAPPSAFTGKGSLAGPEMSDIGDMNSPMADVTHGLMSLFAFTPLAPIADALSLASTLGLTGDREFGDMGLLSGLFGLAEEAAPETVDSISEAFSGIVDPVSDVISQGYRSLATPVGEAFGEVGEAFGEAFGEVGEAFGEVGEAVGEGISSIDLPNIDLSLPNIDLSLPNIDLSLPNLGDWSGDPSLSTDVPQGGGPGIAMPSPKPIEPLPPYISPTFREDYPDTDDSQDYQRQTSFFDQELTLQDILNRYSGTSNTVTAQEGGGMQGLINNQNKEYSIRNQSTVPSFNKATPHPDLISGSEGYISNILKGHTVPMGMTNVQQMQKPIEAFPTGGQMNTTNTQYADYSKPQSFYAMPNMNRVT